MTILRRDALKTGLVGTTALVGSTADLLAAENKKRPRVAAIFTVCTYRSHAHVILENFLEKYLFNGRPTDPGVDVVSFYGDQFPQGEMSRELSKRYKIPLFPTIADALCVGGKGLAVDAALLIGEHGSYPSTKFGQRKYPRKRFFDETIAVIRKAGRPIPIFNDKHLSYRWDWAKEMYDTARALKIPFLAGSSVPLAQRRPPMELPKGADIEEAVSIHAGPLESYDFHGLEVLQSMVEARKGGETGVAQVEFLEGDAVWRAGEKGRWSIPLAQAAMEAELGAAGRDLRKVQGEHAIHALLVHYKSGLKACVLRLGYDSTRWNFACRLRGQKRPQATALYVGPWQNRNLFKALSHAIQTHFRTRKAPYPVERTLLVTGILDAAMRARKQNPGARRDTPHLEFGYAPRDYRAMREMGATWKILTPDLAEPREFTGGPLG